MNIFVVTPFVPGTSVMSGSPRAVFDRLRLLAPAHRISVACFAGPGEDSDARELRDRGIAVYTAPREAGPPRPGLQRWHRRSQLARGLLTQRRPILVQEFATQRMRRLVGAALRDEIFDVILVEHILMAQYLNDLARIPPIILSDLDVRAGLPVVRRGHRLDIAALLYRVDGRAWLGYKVQSWRRATAVTVPTIEDAAVIKRLSGVQPIVLPFGHVYPAEERPYPSASRQNDSLLFVGNFDHPPNVDAALRLANEILPLVLQAHPAAHLWLVGKNPPPEVKALYSRSVTVTGEVETVTPFLRQCAVFAAPLREGGGMRVKVMEALSAGMCCVTTTVGARGLRSVSGWHLLVADNVPDFAALLVRVLVDTSLREQIGRAGRELVRSTAGEAGRCEDLELLLRRVANVVQHA
jgi:glycosyltransferase involved in cell wall biosynthesis